MVKGISAVDSIYRTAKQSVKRTTKNVAQKISDNKDGIIATTALAGGITLYGVEFARYVNRNDEVVNVNPKIPDEPGFIQKITEKIKEKFTIDLEHVPEGVNPADKYITDIDGNILYSDITNLPYPNPWYNPELAAQKIQQTQNAAETLLSPKVSMESFLENASEHTNNALNTIAATDIPFGDSTDIVEPDADMAEGVLSYLKELIDNIGELI